MFHNSQGGRGTRLVSIQQGRLRMWVSSDMCDTSESNEQSEPSETTETNKASRRSERGKTGRANEATGELVNQATDDQELPMPFALNVVQLSKHCL